MNSYKKFANNYNSVTPAAFPGAAQDGGLNIYALSMYIYAYMHKKNTRPGARVSPRGVVHFWSVGFRLHPFLSGSTAFRLAGSFVQCPRNANRALGRAFKDTLPEPFWLRPGFLWVSEPPTCGSIYIPRTKAPRGRGRGV